MQPIEQYSGVMVKRGDLYTVAGVNGGKAQVIEAMAQGAAGLITSGPRVSSQIYIGARIAAAQGIPFRCHLPGGKATPEMADVLAHGGEIIQHHPGGYNNVLAARAKADGKARPGCVVVPLWLRGPETVRTIRAEVANVPDHVERLVVVVGSGMTLAAVLHGLADKGLDTPVLGVRVGADPVHTLNSFAPFGWANQCELVTPATSYAEPLRGIEFGGIELDPRYEAKCVEYLEAGDLFWIAGHGIHHPPWKD